MSVVIGHDAIHANCSGAGVTIYYLEGWIVYGPINLSDTGRSS